MKKCPKCNIDWEEEETIYDYFLGKYLIEFSKSMKVEEIERKAMETANCYGHTEENPKHFGKNHIGIEDPDKYDGVSYWLCTNCNTTFNRWTMQEEENI